MWSRCWTANLDMWPLILTLLAAARAQDLSNTGFLGCRFSSVCQPNEECINDALFGNCQKYDEPQDSFQYYLDKKTLGDLQEEITRLLGDGYTWHNIYTQCVLTNILLAFRKGVDHDKHYCDRPANDPDLSEDLTAETLAQLQKFFQTYYNQVRGQDLDSREVYDDFSGPHEKKDEFVTIHKYFSQEKRDEEEAEDLDRILAQLQPQDLKVLQTYLQDLDAVAPSEDLEDLPLEEYPDDLPEEVPQIEDGNAPLVSSEILEEEPDVLAMSPPDAKLLSDLLQERISVNDLDGEEVGRLLGYVNAMLRGMEEEDALAAEAGQMDQDKYTDTRAYEEPIQDIEVPPVKKEQMNAAVLESPSGMVHVRVNHAPGLQAQPLHPTRKRDPSPQEEIAEEEAAEEALNPDQHDHGGNGSPDLGPKTEAPAFDIVDAHYAYVHTKPEITSIPQAAELVQTMEQVLGLPSGTLRFVNLDEGDVSFEVKDNPELNATALANRAMARSEAVKNVTGLTITNAGIGRETRVSVLDNNGPKYFVLTFALCGSIAGVVLAVIALYIVRRHTHSKDKLKQLASANPNGDEASKDYQDLCRQRMQGKTSDKPEPLSATSRVASVNSEAAVHSPSSRSSTSSWSEEPVQSNMDISTGHIVLSYMEDHLKNKDRLDEEWENLVAYEPDVNTSSAGAEASNMRKNRYTDIIPYDHSRVVLSSTTNVSGSDFINASTITDHDPRNPAYIATQGPLPHTVADFWQMVWEQGSVVIVMLTKLTENGVAMCHRYWPEEGSDLYHIYEVHLVSEHIWCDDYLVRSFYLKNLQTNETRTVTQFHFLTWPDLGIPSSTKALLDFRRKVNKSYRGRSCPITIHCSDGVGRTGTYCLVDMVLNRLSKGAKEIDIAATLEHIRDQRMSMAKTKEQFEFALAAVAEEVHAILKALPQ